MKLTLKLIPTLLLRRTSAAEVTKSSQLKDSNVKNKARFESVADLSDKLTYQQATKDFAIDATKPILAYNVPPSRLGYSRDPSKPIGSSTDIGFHTIEVPFVPGDILFLFSDGLTQVNGVHPDQYSEKRVRKIFESSGTDNISYVKDKLLKSFNDFCGSHSLKDDVTFVFIKFQSEASAKSTQPLAEFFRHHA